MERRLLAIMAVDVVGYSKLMERDEGATLDRLKALRRSIFAPAVAAHRGRVLKLMGDGALVDFPSVTEAVFAAVQIQERIAAEAVSAAIAEPVALRIGINVSDVMIEGGDVYGDGVNLAARIEAMAEPGGILLSGHAAEHVRATASIRLVDRGEHRFKNLSRPVRIFAVARSDEPDGPGLAPAPSNAVEDPASDGLYHRPSVAVLPFVNFSGDPEQDHFVDGLTEDLIAALSCWRSFPVIARNSTFAFRGRQLGAHAIADALAARYLLEGSVRTAGSRVRITAQLMDAERGVQVWSERFDRGVGDVFDIQDDISRRIAATVAPELEHAEVMRNRGRSHDLTAWDHYVRGMRAFNLETCEDYGRARACFAAAAERDPDFAEAIARLAWTHLREIPEGCTDDKETSLSAAYALVRRALAVDDASAVAHLCLGTAHIWSGQLEAGLAEAERALSLNPSYAHAAMALGNRLDLVGRTQEGIARMRVGLQLNPRDPQHRWTYMLFLSRAHLSLGDHEAALDWCGQAVNARPEHPEVHFRHAVCLAHLDRVAEAQPALNRAETLRPGFLASKYRWRPYRDMARNTRFFHGLHRHHLFAVNID